MPFQDDSAECLRSASLASFLRANHSILVYPAHTILTLGEDQPLIVEPTLDVLDGACASLGSR